MTIEYLKKPYLPVETTQIERAFPAQVYPLMPPWEAIPTHFRRRHTEWNDMFGRWFYAGVTDKSMFVPKKGIPAETAYWHLQCIMKSYQPQHEHKEAAVAYLASLWFDVVILDDEHVYGDVGAVLQEG